MPHSLSPGRLPQGGGLRWKLWILTLLAALCIGLLAGATLYQSVGGFVRAKLNARAISQFAASFEAANHISAERGPANDLMSADPARREPARRRLQQYRARTDRSLRRLATTQLPAGLLARVERDLELARQRVDTVALLDPAARRFDQVQAAIDAMFAAWDSYSRLIQWQAAQLVRQDEALSAAVLKSMSLGNLREYAGRIGSYIVAPMAAGMEVPVANRIQLQIARGRLLELWQLLSPGIEVLPAADPVRQQHELARRHYLRHGLALVDQLLNEYPYPMDALAFTDHYVATMQPLETLRNLLLGQTLAQAEQHRQQAWRTLWLLGLITLLALLLLAALVLALQYYVFGPLLRAADAVFALADGDAEPPRARRQDAGEIRRLFAAMGIVSDRLRERARLTRELEQLAITDSLTGLLNRRAIDRLGRKALAGTRRQDTPCLILIDVDHFKAINDTHGHPAGDQVLRELAGLMRAQLRPSDHLGRFGGEEFAVLIEGAGLAQATRLARRLKRAIRHHRLDLDNGARLTITASLGVAGGPGLDWEQMIALADQALYRAKAAGRDRVRSQRAPDTTD